MCGINGIIYYKKRSEISEDINKMNNKIIHRGPDDDGVYVHEDTVAMGMRRLSIIDLSTGSQPMFNSDKSLVIVFNGELYNYLELKKKLINSGFVFKTSSDTEVVLKAYEVYGLDCLNMFNGMFVFSIHDRLRNKIIIARDRFGEKPIYYHKNEIGFYWSSELKSIITLIPNLKHKISNEALSLYLSLTYIPAPYSIYEGVYKLEAGKYLTINLDSNYITIAQYWDIEYGELQFESYSIAQRQLKELLYDSVRIRLLADVPLGMFLSGGVDSSIIAAIMAEQTPNKKITTFSIGFDDKRYDESERALIVAKHLKTDHHNFRLSSAIIQSEVDKIILNFDEPFADASSIPTYFVARETAKYVKVALTGDGGDEVFGGYNKYLIHSLGSVYNKYMPGVVHNHIINPIQKKIISPKNTRSKSYRIKRFFDAVDTNWYRSHLNIISLGFNEEEKRELIKLLKYQEMGKIVSSIVPFQEIDRYDVLKGARYIDTHISLEGDMLVKVDRTSMQNSIECRCPFLDYRLMDFSYSIPDNYLLKGLTKKRILKDTFKSLLPTNFLNLPKKGFEMPIGNWFRSSLRNDLEQTLSRENIEKYNIFEYKTVKNYLDNHLEKNQDQTNKLWVLYCFIKWHESISN